jgi:hypothetical protein
MLFEEKGRRQKFPHGMPPFHLEINVSREKSTEMDFNLYLSPVLCTNFILYIYFYFLFALFFVCVTEV